MNLDAKEQNWNIAHYFQQILHKKIIPNGLLEIVIEKAAQ
jgi:hypothetical protein